MNKYTMPEVKSEHEGTWLQWPHAFTYGEDYKKELEPIWVRMTTALSEGERVHIVAYNERERERIAGVLFDHGVDLARIDFFIAPTDDVWARDHGPMFVYDANRKLNIWDPGFNGWGQKVPYEQDARLRERLGRELRIETIPAKELVIEGGAMEMDGKGTFLTTPLFY